MRMFFNHNIQESNSIVAIAPNRFSPPTILLREGFRENGKVKNKTIANLSSWIKEKIDVLWLLLRNEKCKRSRLKPVNAYIFPT